MSEAAVGARVQTFPVIEIFGPTIQGEGALAGLTTHFVRFGGCDYRCSWCDSMYAVDPAEVRENATKMTEREIVEALLHDRVTVKWVTLSGGNPAMLNLGGLIDRLHDQGIKVAVETQGSRWRDWLGKVDCLTVSPKPPSSGMVSSEHDTETRAFMTYATDATQEVWVLRNRDVRALKIVVFDETDFDWAKRFILDNPQWPAYMSVGTDQPDPEIAHLSISHTAALRTIADRYRWLCEKVANDHDLVHVRVLPQLHVLAWGHAKGV